jgi:hypothetical protein
MIDWQTQVDKLLADYEGITHELSVWTALGAQNPQL